MIETPRLVLRRWKESDREPFYRMNSDPRVMEFFPACLTREESDSMIERIEALFATNGFSFFAAELRTTGELAGFIGLNVPGFDAYFAPCVEIGWRLAAAHWNQGLATEGAAAALQWGFNQLRIPEIVAFAVRENRPSRRVMEKLGMVYDGEFDHPRLPEGHHLQRHVLYRKAAAGVP